MKQLLHLLLQITCPFLSVNAQDTANTFSQQELFSIILKYHPVAKQADINIEKTQADILTARGGFDPQITTSIAQKTFDGTEYYNHSQPEVRIPTWYGIELVAGAEYLDGKRTNREETLGQTSYAGVVIPFAKNLLMDKRRAALQTAKVFRNLSEVEKRSTINNLLLDASKAYWNWALQYQQYNVISNAVAINEKRFELIKISFRQGDKPALDTTEALTQLQSFRYLQQEALLQVQNAVLDLSVFLWQNDGGNYELPPDVVPANNLVTENIDISVIPVLDELLTLARMGHPDLQQYAFKLDALAIEKKLKFNELLPKLDFKYNQLGKGYNLLNAKSGPLFNNNFQYGIGFAIPLRLSQGRGEYRKAKLKITETWLDQQMKAVLVENKIKSYYNELVALRSQVGILEKAYQNFVRLQKGEELKFFNGESSLFMVNSRENKALDALQKLLKKKSDYFKVFNTLQWSAGLLL
ncbi:MAG: TolC family protein [Ginsengibacter sp.]